MRYSAFVPAALALAVGMGGLAQAQGTSTPATTASPTSPTPGTAPAGPTATPNTPVTTPSAPTAMTPRADTGAPVVSGTNSATNNAVNTKGQNNAGAPVAGANSFTRNEARRRIQNHGFRQVTDLKLDGQGIWRGKATKGGKSVDVSMDYQGNVVSQ